MNDLRKISALICAALFIASGVTTLLFFNIERKAFSSNTFKTAFKQEMLYEQVPAIMAEILTNSNNNGAVVPELFSLINKNDLEPVIASLLPPAQLEILTNSALDATFVYLNSEADTVTISLSTFKQSLTSEDGINISIQQIMNSQPNCTTEQLLQMGLDILFSSGDIITCKPPADMMGLVMPIIKSQLQTMIGKIPDELTIIQADNLRALRFRAKLDKLRALMQITPLLSLIFLLTLTLLVVRGLNDWLKWWGVPFIIMGVSSIFLALTGTPVIRAMMKAVILEGNENMPFVFANLLQNVTGSLARQILNPIAIQGLIIALIGVGMLLWNKYGVKMSAGNKNQTIAY